MLLMMSCKNKHPHHSGTRTLYAPGRAEANQITVSTISGITDTLLQVAMEALRGS